MTDVGIIILNKVMGSKGKEATQRFLAITIIMAMLFVMGIPWTVVFFFAVVVYFVWRAVQRSEQQETRSIFEFYLAANEILRDEEKHWYGFEIAEVIGRGEGIMHTMKDPPPLVYFTLGALYHRANEYEAAAEHLSYVVENEYGDEGHHLAPSPELRRYVQVLRRLERDPAEAPQTMAAIRNLDRARRTRAAALLAQSRERQKMISQTPASDTAPRERKIDGVTSKGSVAGNRQPTLTPPMPPPIADVLRNVYEEEKKTA